MNSFFTIRVVFFLLLGMFMGMDMQASEAKMVATHMRSSRPATVPCKGRLGYSCSKFFTSSGNMEVHFAAAHLGLKPYVCPECNRPFSKKQNMLVHRDTHRDIRRFKCPLCSQSFSQKGNMKRHYNTHSKVGKFKCDWCSRRFKCREYKLKHQKTCNIRTRKEKDCEERVQNEVSAGHSEDMYRDILCGQSLVDLSMKFFCDEEGSSDLIDDFPELEDQQKYALEETGSDSEEELSRGAGPLSLSCEQSQQLKDLAQSSNYNNLSIDLCDL